MSLMDPPPIVEELATAHPNKMRPVFDSATARSVGEYLKALHAAVVQCQKDIEQIKEV